MSNKFFCPPRPRRASRAFVGTVASKFARPLAAVPSRVFLFNKIFNLNVAYTNTPVYWSICVWSEVQITAVDSGCEGGVDLVVLEMETEDFVL